MRQKQEDCSKLKASLGYILKQRQMKAGMAVQCMHDSSVQEIETGG